MNLTPEQQAKDEIQMRTLELALTPHWRETQHQFNQYGVSFGPPFYADLARNNQEAGHYLKAAALYKKARCVTLGHSRAEIYRIEMERCRELAGPQPVMKAYHKLVDLALQHGLLISVYDGETWEVKRSQDRKEIVEAIEAVEEAQLSLRDTNGNRVGWALIIPHGVGDDETVADHTDNEFMNRSYDQIAAD